MNTYVLSHLSDPSLDRALESAARDDSRATASLLAHIAESDARRRHAPAGYPSMFEYCVGHPREPCRKCTLNWFRNQLA